MPRGTKRSNESGLSFIEMMVAAAVLMVLASAVIPLARWDQKRRVEVHLRVHLRTMRDAIDRYKQFCDEGLIAQEDVEQMCYPLTLEDLAEPVIVGDPTTGKEMRFLRRIPVDPFTGEASWGVRSYQDDFDSKNSGGENVYDVYSLSPKRALDDTYYETW